MDTRPAYYAAGDDDLLAFALRHGLNGIVFNIWKYTYRAGKKPGTPALDDLHKAREYLDRWIAFLEAKKKP